MKKKPEGLESGIALREHGGVPKPTAAGELQKQLLLHDLVMAGAVRYEQAQTLGYIGTNVYDPVRSMLITLKDTVADSLGYDGHISIEQAKSLAADLVSIGWTPPEAIEP